MTNDTRYADLDTTQIRQVQFPEPGTLVLTASERSPRDGVMTTTTITWSRQSHNAGNSHPAFAALGVHLPTRRPPLSYDVFVSPEKSFAAPPLRVGDPPAWDPTTSTLIFGAHEAVLVDALMTVREATALADWVALHDRQLTTIYITHGYGDHWFGLPVLFDRLPHARGSHCGSGDADAQRRAEQQYPRTFSRSDRRHYRAG